MLSGGELLYKYYCLTVAVLQSDGTGITVLRWSITVIQIFSFSCIVVIQIGMTVILFRMTRIQNETGARPVQYYSHTKTVLQEYFFAIL